MEAIAGLEAVAGNNLRCTAESNVLWRKRHASGGPVPQNSPKSETDGKGVGKTKRQKALEQDGGPVYKQSTYNRILLEELRTYIKKNKGERGKRRGERARPGRSVQPGPSATSLLVREVGEADPGTPQVHTPSSKIRCPVNSF